MDTRSAIAQNLRRQVLNYGKPLAKFSRDFDIPLTSLKSYVKGDANLRADTIDLLARKLDVTPADLLSAAPSDENLTSAALRAAGGVPLWPQERQKRLADLLSALLLLISEDGAENECLIR